ncbi:MAG: hypothetical protein ACYCT1_20030 [Steroidobacteraceae bacterium]
MEHKSATFMERPFAILNNINLERNPSGIHVLATKGDLESWASEADIQRKVTVVFGDAITDSGLKQVLRCLNELSIFKLRADIWVVVNNTGSPVGVVEVKKPGSKIMGSEYVHGQIYDYMMRLKSFHGLRNVFGVVSTYVQWRIYWLSDCDDIAAAEQVPTSVAGMEEICENLYEAEEEISVALNPLQMDKYIIMLVCCSLWQTNSAWE